jgi:hypothetical protein
MSLGGGLSVFINRWWVSLSGLYNFAEEGSGWRQRHRQEKYQRDKSGTGDPFHRSASLGQRG